MTSTSRGRSSSGTALCAVVLFLTTACTTSPEDASEAADPPTPIPSATWGDWAEVDEAVMPVGSTADRVIMSGLDSPTVSALDRATGDEVWRVGDGTQDGTVSGTADEGDEWDTGPAWEHGLVLHDEDTVYTQRGSGDGSLVAYSASDGTEQWRMTPGDLDACAPADGWELSPSISQTHEVAESGRLILSHTEIAEWDCHDGPNATHPGRPTMVVVDAQTGETVGDPVEVSGTSIPGRSLPDPSGRFIDVPYELQSSVNVIRVDAETGEERWAMLHYPQDLSYEDIQWDPTPPTVTAAGGDRFLILYDTGDAFLATVDEWAQDHTSTGDVTVEDLEHEMPCEYRMQRSSSGDPYCLLLTSPPEPEYSPQFRASLFDRDSGEPTGQALAVDAAPSIAETDEYYGYVDDPTAVGNDALIPSAALQGDRPAIVLPAEAGLTAVEMETQESLWSWDSGTGAAVGAHVVPDAMEVIVGLEDRVVGVDAMTGDEVWDEPADGPLFGVGDVVTITDFMTQTTRVRTTHPVG